MKSLVTLKALRVAGLATSSSQTLLYVITTRRARYNNRFQDFCCEVLQEESPGPCSSTSGWGASGPAASTSEERATPAHLLLYRDDQRGSRVPDEGAGAACCPHPTAVTPDVPPEGGRPLRGVGALSILSGSLEVKPFHTCQCPPARDPASHQPWNKLSLLPVVMGRNIHCGGDSGGGLGKRRALERSCRRTVVR